MRSKNSRLKRFKEGVKNMSMAQQLQAKLIGHIGAIVGLTLAMVLMIARGSYYFVLFLFFICWLQAVEIIGTKQRYTVAKNMEASLEAQKENLKKLVGDG